MEVPLDNLSTPPHVSLRLWLAAQIFPECQVFLILLMEGLGSQKLSDLLKTDHPMSELVHTHIA